MAVTSYAPELLQIFQFAARGPLTIPLGNRAKAIRLRARLNYLRADMRKERHPLTNLANTIEFVVTREHDLLCRAADSTFVDAIRRAGVTITPNSVIPSPDSISPDFPQSFGGDPSGLDRTGDITVEDLLSKLFGKESEK